MRRLALLLLAGALAAGCTVHPARAGVVVGKYQVDPWTETWMSYQCVAYNGSGGCTMQMPIWHRTDHPRSWWVTIHSDKAIQQGKDTGRGVFADWPIRYDLWLRVETGQHLDVAKRDEAAH